MASFISEKASLFHFFSLPKICSMGFPKPAKGIQSFSVVTESFVVRGVKGIQMQ